MTFNIDTIASTLVAGAIVVVIAFWAKRKLTATNEDHVPTKIQLAWEFVITEVTNQVESNLGRVNPFVVPLAVALFFFILTANWIGVFPSELNHDVHLLPSPTADTNLTYAMAFLVIVGVFTFGIREQGWKGYFKHYFEPYPCAVPARADRGDLKPFTLALRLFGNIFAGGIMLALIRAGRLDAEQHPARPVLTGSSTSSGSSSTAVPRSDPGVHLRAADHPLLRDGRWTRRATTRTSTPRGPEGAAAARPAPGAQPAASTTRPSSTGSTSSTAQPRTTVRADARQGETWHRSRTRHGHPDGRSLHRRWPGPGRRRHRRRHR